MAKFNFLVQKDNSDTVISIYGNINEDVILPGVDFSGAQTAFFDWGKVEMINSCGVREWVMWLKKVPSNVKVVYRNCPRIIVDQINLVAGFLRPGSEVESFYVPFFCEKCEIQTPMLFTKGKEFIGNKVETPAVSCQKCKGPTEIDIIESKYFKFLSL